MRNVTMLAGGVLAAAMMTGCQGVQLPEDYEVAFTPKPASESYVRQSRGAQRSGYRVPDQQAMRPGTTRDQGGIYPYGAVLPTVPPRTAETATAPFPVNAADPADPFQAGAPALRPAASVMFDPLAPAPAAARVALPAAPPPAPLPVYDAAAARTHVVKKGDNYWELAKQYYGDATRFVDIERANPGKDPRKLQLGDEIIIPE